MRHIVKIEVVMETETKLEAERQVASWLDELAKSVDNFPENMVAVNLNKCVVQNEET